MSTIRIQALPKFPASVEAGDGIVINRSGGVFTFSLDTDVVPDFSSALPLDVGDMLVADSENSLGKIAAATGDARQFLGYTTGAGYAWSQVPLGSAVSGILGAVNGGTGAATLAGLVKGNGTGVMTAIADSSTIGQVLRVTGEATYAWGPLDLADTDAVTGTLAIVNGGTGGASQAAARTALAVPALTANTFSGIQTINLAGAGGGSSLVLLSGAAGNFSSLGIGRAGPGVDALIGVAGATNDFLTGTAAGDLALRGSTGALWLGAGSSAPGIRVSATGTLRFSQYASGILAVDGAGNLSARAANAILFAQPANPTGTASGGAGVMMGIGGTCAITPVNNTRLKISLSGNLANATATAGAFVNIRYGTGTAPTNGAAATGTQATLSTQATQLLAGQNVPFSQTTIISGLTAGTAYWIDACVGIIGSGTATVTGLNCAAAEV